MGDLLEKMATSYAAFIECVAARDAKAPLCMDDEMCACRKETEFLFVRLLDAIAQPSEAQLAAAEALPITGQINNMIMMHAARNGGIEGGSGLPGPPDTPIEQWYRAMIAVLRKEVDGG